jgi:hypothetical protein
MGSKGAHGGRNNPEILIALLREPLAAVGAPACRVAGGAGRSPLARVGEIAEGMRKR